MKALFNFANDSFDVAEALESPRVLKTHLPLQFLPKEFFTKKPKVVFVYRDAAEAAIAYYYLACAIGCYSGSKEDFVELFMNGGGPYLPFWQHMASFDQYFATNTNILSVEYSLCKNKIFEDLLEDLCQFLGKGFPEKVIVEKLNEHLQMYTDNDGINTHDREYRLPIEIESMFNDWCALNSGKALNISRIR